MVKLRLNNDFFVLLLGKKKKRRCFNPGKKVLTQGPAFFILTQGCP